MKSTNEMPEVEEVVLRAELAEAGYVGASIVAREQNFCSMQAVTQEDKVKLYNMMNEPDETIGDNIGKVINLRHVFMETIMLTNEETGELEAAPRTILIDENGKSYSATSSGIKNSLEKLFKVFGTPDEWNEALPVEFIQKNVNSRRIYKLKAV